MTITLKLMDALDNNSIKLFDDGYIDKPLKDEDER